MKIAICDDTQSDLENLKNCLVEYFNEKQIPFSIDGFNNCNVLLNRIKFLDSNEYELFILDVIMQKNGVDIAKEIRKYNELYFKNVLDKRMKRQVTDLEEISAKYIFIKNL